MPLERSSRSRSPSRRRTAPARLTRLGRSSDDLPDVLAGVAGDDGDGPEGLLDDRHRPWPLKDVRRLGLGAIEVEAAGAAGRAYDGLAALDLRDEVALVEPCRPILRLAFE